MAEDIGKRGTRKRVAELKKAGIEVPFNSAWAVFSSNTLPRFYSKTQSIYPSLDLVPDFCRSVLVSLVFNRGASLAGPKRREMRNIRDILNTAGQTGLGKTKTRENPIIPIAWYALSESVPRCANAPC